MTMQNAGGAIAISAVVLLAATACGGSGSKSSTSSAANSSSAPPSSSVAAPSTPASSSSAIRITQAELDAAMLQVSDIGGFTVGTYRRNTNGGPCEPTGTPSVDQRVPPQVESGRTFDSTKVNAELVQEAAVYSTSAEAARAFTLAVRGTSCRHGVLSDGTKVTISAGQDVTAQVNGNSVGKSTAWQLSNASIQGVIVATLSGRVANACIFVAAANADTSQLPNPIAVAKIAFKKLLSH